MPLTKVSFGVSDAPTNVLSFGAKGDGYADDGPAFQAAINHAIANGGEVFVPGGSYLIETEIQIPFPGGVKIRGVSPNSLGTRSAIYQKSVETPVFSVNGINVSMSGLSFTTWAGSIIDANGNPITAIGSTSTTITLSADPWIGGSPVIWSPLTPLVSTDGTSFPNVIQISIAGSFYASGATRNPNGTVTLTGVKGANLTPNAQILNVVGSPVGAFVSLAHASSPPTNPNAAIIYIGVKENHFYEDLWFNQVTSPFTLSDLGSGAGPGLGVGAIGFMSNIVCDQAIYFLKGLGDINNLQCVNSQFFGIQTTSFYAPFGSITSCTFSNNQVIIGKFAQVNNDIDGCTIVGNNFNGISGYGYSDLLFNVGGQIKETTIVGNNMGRSTGTVIQVDSISGSTISGNTITSSDEGPGPDPWMQVTTDITNSYIGGNNFAKLYTSNDNLIGFLSATPSVSGSVFGGEVIGRQSGTKVIGWLSPTFQNSWTNVGSGAETVEYFKDENGVVYLKGQIVGGSAGTVAFTLPSGHRPSGLMRLYGRANTSSGEVPMSFTIASNGDVTIDTSVVSWGDFGSVMFSTR